MRPGDFLILLRHRDELVDALVRELKSLEVPVAGIDRMRLTEQLAVMDLIAFGQFLLLPEDDFNLAVLLKSPLLGWSEEALFDLAHGRRGSLWEELRRRAKAAEPSLPRPTRCWPSSWARSISCRPMSSMPISWRAMEGG